MENASKALIMAGGILIALLVIGLLVFFYNNLSSLKSIEQSGEELEIITEFNKQYEVYTRNIYGSEILSLANKIADYNKNEADNKGYSPIELQIVFESDASKELFKKGTYTSSKIVNEVEKLETKVEQIGNESIRAEGTIYSRKVSQLAKMRTKDIEDLGFSEAQYKQQVTNYNTYKTLLSEIKSKTFKYVGVEYDKNTGRITLLKYKL